MNHQDEKWQEYGLNGEPVMNGGYPASRDNPPFSSDTRVGGSCVWLYRHTEQGIEILLQKRSNYVSFNKGKWDTSAAGHMNYGESITEAALREAREEIGITLEPARLVHILSLPNSPTGDTDVISNCYNHHFLYDWTGRTDDFHFDDKEVAEVRWIPLAEFDDFIEAHLKENIKANIPLISIVKTWLSYYENH